MTAKTGEMADFDEQALHAGLEFAADSPNYLDWLADLCAPHLGSRCLEIGSGHGHLTERLAVGRSVVATDVSSICLDKLRERFSSDAAVQVRELNLDHYEPDREQFDSVVLMNVLEHIEDDDRALRVLGRALRPGGRIVLYVPAFMLLYSDWDRRIGHFRRYRKRGLSDLLETAGFEVTEMRYVNAIGAIAWFTYWRVLRRRGAGEGTGGVFDRIVVPTARFFEDRLSPPFGVSLLAVGTTRG